MTNPKLWSYLMSNGARTQHPGSSAPQTEITLRDLFAAAAHIGIRITNPTIGTEVAAREAYEQADAMLAEREK